METQVSGHTISVLEVNFSVMHPINSRFTYLLTLLTIHYSVAELVLPMCSTASAVV